MPSPEARPRPGSPTSLFIAADHLVLPGRLAEPGWVEVRDGRIAAIGDSALLAGRHAVSAAWLSPGFVDLHSHGGGGGTFQHGRLEEVRRTRSFQIAHGTTRSVASLVTAPIDEMARSASALAELARDGIVDGIHFEGPFLSPARRGAHDAALLREPATHVVARLAQACRDVPFMVTIAPELPGAMRAIRQIVDAGGVAAVGHTDATHDVTTEAVKAGARVATHLFNAMPPIHHRRPGAVVALLENDDVVLEVINDDEHVDRALVRYLLATAGPDRVALVTDAMSAAGMPDGAYAVATLAVEVRGGVARLEGNGVLAGSTLTMDAAVRRALEGGVPLLDAFIAATRTPARAIGIGAEAGSIEVGRRADLVLLDEALRVRQVMVRGAWAEVG